MVSMSGRSVLIAYMVLIVTALHCVGGIEESCKDKLDNCHNYNKDVCKTYPDWSRTNCARTCLLCAVCPDGWAPYDEDKTCMTIVDIRKTWSEAKECCMVIESEMVIIKDEKKNAYVKENFGKFDYIWLGVRRSSQANEYKYVDGTPMAYNNGCVISKFDVLPHGENLEDPWWYNKTDRGTPDDDCVLMLNIGGKGMWMNHICSSTLYSVCESSTLYQPVNSSQIIKAMN